MSRIRYTAKVLRDGCLSVPEDLELGTGQEVKVVLSLPERKAGNRNQLFRRRGPEGRLASPEPQRRRDAPLAKATKNAVNILSCEPKQGTGSVQPTPRVEEKMAWAEGLLKKMPPGDRQAFIERQRQLDELMARAKGPRDLARNWSSYLYGRGPRA